MSDALAVPGALVPKSAKAARSRRECIVVRRNARYHHDVITPAKHPPELPLLLRKIQEQLPATLGLWLFGSHARGQARADSDIDLAVLTKGPVDPVRLFDLGLELGVLAQRDVDLIDLRQAPLVLRKEVLTTGHLLACHDQAACEAFIADSMALYVAFRDELALASPPPRGRP
jgi:predicted nucleotidyltransferase